MKIDAIQSAKGKIWAAKAQRDAKGRFVKAGRLKGLFAVQPEVQPNIQPGTQPECAKNIRSGQNPAEIQPKPSRMSSPASSRKSSLYVTAAITQENDAEKKRKLFREKRGFIKHQPQGLPGRLGDEERDKDKAKNDGGIGQLSAVNSQLRYNFMPQGFTTDPKLAFPQQETTVSRQGIIVSRLNPVE
jgi:hypothetical protein